MKICKILGIDFHLALSFFIFFGIIIFSGAETIWFYSMLYFSVLVHEFCHALTAKQLGYNVPKIELNGLGGFAHIDKLIKATARDELLIIGAGPLSNLIFAFYFYILNYFFPSPPIKMLMGMNLFLVVFNLIPIAPLDGSKILKSLLYLWHDDKLRAIETSYIVSVGSTGLVLAFSMYFQQYNMCMFYLIAFLMGYVEYHQSKLFLENS
jgi:Zn-dependent protease